MTELEKIIAPYDQPYYDQDTDTICIDSNEIPVTIAEDAKWLIEDHFEGEIIDAGDNTDPDSERVRLTGAEYVKHVGGIVDAFKLAGVKTW